MNTPHSPTDNPRPTLAREEMVLVPRYALEWLDGFGPDLDGTWFDPQGDTRPYWWRARFRAMRASAPSAAPASAGAEADRQAEAEFTDYFVRNYPGPDTIIYDPNWHAPKIFRAARHALRIALAAPSPATQEPVAWAYEFHDFEQVWPRAVILNRPDGDANPPTQHHGSQIRNVRPLYAHPAPATLSPDARLREVVQMAETTLLRYCNEAQAGRYPSDAREFERRVDVAFREIRAALAASPGAQDEEGGRDA